jgi:hypothetical protein
MHQGAGNLAHAYRARARREANNHRHQRPVNMRIRDREPVIDLNRVGLPAFNRRVGNLYVVNWRIILYISDQQMIDVTDMHLRQLTQTAVQHGVRDDRIRGLGNIHRLFLRAINQRNAEVALQANAHVVAQRLDNPQEGVPALLEAQQVGPPLPLVAVQEPFMAADLVPAAMDDEPINHDVNERREDEIAPLEDLLIINRRLYYRVVYPTNWLPYVFVFINLVAYLAPYICLYWVETTLDWSFSLVFATPMLFIQAIVQYIASWYVWRKMGMRIKLRYEYTLNPGMPFFTDPMLDLLRHRKFNHAQDVRVSGAVIEYLKLKFTATNLNLPGSGLTWIPHVTTCDRFEQHVKNGILTADLAYYSCLVAMQEIVSMRARYCIAGGVDNGGLPIYGSRLG